MFITINNLQKQYTDYNTVSDLRYHFKEPLDIDENWEVTLLSIHVSTSTRVTDLKVSCDFIESLSLLNEKKLFYTGPFNGILLQIYPVIYYPVSYKGLQTLHFWTEGIEKDPKSKTKKNQEIHLVLHLRKK